MKGQKLFLPVTNFNKVKPDKYTTYDDRYIPAEIVVMHSGLNKNYSYFSNEAIEGASWSLSDVPILGFIKEIDENEYDFDGHNVAVITTEDGSSIEILGKIIGNIPKENQYHYTVFPDKEETYVVVQGYLWAEYMNKALDIFDKKGEKSVSMEIVVDDGYFDDNETFCITEYRYLGICILGDDVEPAMEGAKITIDDMPLETYSKRKMEKEVVDLDKENIKTEQEETETVDTASEIVETSDVKDTDLVEIANDANDEVLNVEVKTLTEGEAEIEVAEETPFDEDVKEDDEPAEETETEQSDTPEILTDELKEELKQLRLFKEEVLASERETKLNELFTVCESKGLDIAEIKENTDGKSFEEIQQEVAMASFLNIFSSNNEQTLPNVDSKAIVKDIAHNEPKIYGRYTDKIKRK